MELTTPTGCTAHVCWLLVHWLSHCVDGLMWCHQWCHKPVALLSSGPPGDLVGCCGATLRVQQSMAALEALQGRGWLAGITDSIVAQFTIHSVTDSVAPQRCHMASSAT
jgi:hypothetical protein